MNWVSIGSGNGLLPVRRQAITWTNAGLLSIGPLETNFSEIRIEIQIFSFTKIDLKMSSAKWRPFCLGEDELLPSYPGEMQMCTPSICVIIDLSISQTNPDLLSIWSQAIWMKFWLEDYFFVKENLLEKEYEQL